MTMSEQHPSPSSILDGLIKEVEGRNRSVDDDIDAVHYHAGVLRRTAAQLEAWTEEKEQENVRICSYNNENEFQQIE
jgi:hypothetical protein